MVSYDSVFASHPPAADVWLTFSADEEDRSLGTEQLVRDWLPTVAPKPAAAVFLEPTEEAIGVSHKGFSWFEIEVLGQAAHGSRPAEGIDAILPLREALCELDRISRRLSERPPDPRLGHASLHGGRIEGDEIIAPPLSESTWRAVVEAGCAPIVAVAGRAFVDRTIAAAERAVIETETHLGANP